MSSTLPFRRMTKRMSALIKHNTILKNEIKIFAPPNYAKKTFSSNTNNFLEDHEYQLFIEEQQQKQTAKENAIEARKQKAEINLMNYSKKQKQKSVDQEELSKPKKHIELKFENIMTRK